MRKNLEQEPIKPSLVESPNLILKFGVGIFLQALEAKQIRENYPYDMTFLLNMLHYDNKRNIADVLASIKTAVVATAASHAGKKSNRYTFPNLADLERQLKTKYAEIPGDVTEKISRRQSYRELMRSKAISEARAELARTKLPQKDLQAFPQLPADRYQNVSPQSVDIGEGPVGVDHPPKKIELTSEEQAVLEILPFRMEVLNPNRKDFGIIEVLAQKGYCKITESVDRKTRYFCRINK